MKTIFLILMVFGLVFGGLFVISGNAALILYCIPTYIKQLTNPQGIGMLVFESCGR